MDVRFEDHALFQGTVVRAVAGSAAVGLAALWLPSALVPLAAIGCGAALIGRGRAALLCGLGGVSAATAALVRPDSAALSVSGALLALGLAAGRPGEARESGARVPRLRDFALAAGLGALTLAAAASILPALAAALAQLFPLWLSLAAASGALGLWVAAASAPLHVSLAHDPVEARLGSLRAALGAELRPLAERAAAARRAALEALVDQVPTGSSRADLRALLESLTLAALDLARRAAELGRASSPSTEEELGRRAAALSERAVKCDDEVARKSWLRAAETIAGQLEHCGKVRRARERLLARLNEEIAQLERARFSLVLLRGADELRSTVELDLLGERLQHGALACEAAAAAAELPESDRESAPSQPGAREALES